MSLVYYFFGTQCILVAYYYYVNRTQGTIFKHRYNQINQYK